MYWLAGRYKIDRCTAVDVFEYSCSYIHVATTTTTTAVARSGSYRSIATRVATAVVVATY